MAKKFFGRLVGLAVVAGAVAAAVTYVKQSANFNKNLDDDFYDFEDEEEGETNRKYSALKNSTDEFISSAKETASVAKGMVAPVKDIFNEVSQIVVDKVKDLAGVEKEETDLEELRDEVLDTVEDIKEVSTEKVEEIKKNIAENTSVVEEEF